MFKLSMTALAASFVAFGAQAGTVNTLDGSQGWQVTDTRPGGTSDIVDVAGMGGNLETNAPAGSGVLKLTTDATNAAKAEIGIAQDFGSVADIINNDFSVSYTWYDAGGAVAAPSLKLAFLNAGYAGDGYGQLVFEPYAQSTSATTYITPTQGDWVTTTVTLNAGRSWNTGMFNIGTSFAGPPNNTLTDWLAAFDNGFDGASLVGVSLGLGSYNPSETGYVDNVSLSINGTTTTWDFETAAPTPAPVPLPAGLPSLMVGLASLGLLARRRKA